MTKNLNYIKMIDYENIYGFDSDSYRVSNVEIDGLNPICLNDKYLIAFKTYSVDYQK